MHSVRYAAMVAALLAYFSIAESCSNCRQSSDLGEKIQHWFSQLGEISNSVAQECSLLPKTDSINKLENRIESLELNLNTSLKNCKADVVQAKTDITVLEGRLKVVEEVLKNLTTGMSICTSPFKGMDVLSGEVPYGKVTCTGMSNGDTCTIQCNKGSYVTGTDTVTCQKGYWSGSFPTCKPAHSCKDFMKVDDGKKSGVFKLWSAGNDKQFEAYCDMATDNGGWTLVAVVANDDTDSWTFSDSDKDYGDVSSLWENSNTLGQLSAATPETPKDYKGEAFLSVPGKEVMITLKGKPYFQTDGDCLNGYTLKNLLNVYRFSCAGSSFICYYGKCMGTGGKGVSNLCQHGCKVTKFYSEAAQAGEPLTNGKAPTILYVKSGEAEKAQDGNKDRVYFSTEPARTNIDYVNGLGAFTGLGQKIHSFDISLYKDVAERPGDKNLFYGIYVR